jgi:2-furoyl-CoA dehydrogenase FAD binding subunit
MKPNSFNYVKARSLEDLLAILREDPDVKILAGGQSLVPMMNMRLAKPETLLDINDVDELQFIIAEHNHIRVGALTRYSELIDSNIINAKIPLLSDVVKHIGYIAIRNRGTIGGSVVHNDPSAEIGVALICLGAEVVLLNCDAEERLVPLDQFFITTYLTDIAANEVLREIRIPIPPAGTGYSFREVSRRVGDFAMVNAAALVQVSERGEITNLSFSIGGIGDVPTRIGLDPLIGHGPIEDSRLDAVVSDVTAGIDPASDNVAGGEYKRHLAGVLLRQTVLEACDRASRSRSLSNSGENGDE